LKSCAAFFARRGVTMESAAIASGLSRQGAQLAPAALLPAVIASSISAPAGASSAAVLAQMTGKAILTAQLKVAGGVIAAVVVLAAGAGVVVSSITPPSNVSVASIEKFRCR